MVSAVPVLDEFLYNSFLVASIRQYYKVRKNKIRFQGFHDFVYSITAEIFDTTEKKINAFTASGPAMFLVGVTATFYIVERWGIRTVVLVCALVFLAHI